jgi:hypothetical protein
MNQGHTIKISDFDGYTQRLDLANSENPAHLSSKHLDAIVNPQQNSVSFEVY